MNKTWVLFCVTAAAGACASCATSTYRIPGGEMQRLAELNVAQRGAAVRIMPHDESSIAYAAVPEPVAPPAPPIAAATSEAERSRDATEQDTTDDGELPDRWTDDGTRVDMQLQMDGGSGGNVPASPRAGHAASGTVHPPVHPRTIAMGGTSPARAPTAVFRGSPGGPGMARIPAPVHAHGGSFHGHGGGGHGGGGGGSFSGGGNGVALLVAVFLVVGLVAIITETATAEPPPYDGWASISPDHPVHLIYGPGAERVIRMRELRPDHLVGLRDTVIKDSEGRLHRLPRNFTAPRTASWSVGQRTVADGP
ncbi:MAG TPA: hypothetical protein VGP07_13195 [Polyangia bacterium]|jgi:uncharacterized membrane protein YgcG